MTYNQLREMWFDFFKKHGHTIIPSASVVPENDPSTIFTTAGMQPLVPFLLGERHPAGKRIANIQRCIRTGDIDEVGDNSHLTFFEMMGNWSLGDYFKRDKVAWSWELLTGKDYLNLPAGKIHVTCFAGDRDAPRDTECADFWKNAGIPADRIHFFDKSENWWAMSSGLGPQGPCSEMFVHIPEKCTCRGKCNCNPANNCGCFMEIGNDVYMQFAGVADGGKIQIEPAKQKNVDTGWGLERILCFVNGKKSVYETELFAPAIDILTNAGVKSEREKRIIAEHTRAAAVIISDGVVPSNSGAGYVLRRLIRRAVRNANTNNLPADIYEKLIRFYNSYLEFDFKTVMPIFSAEVAKFEKTIQNGLKEFENHAKRGKTIDGKLAFYLYETYGFPIELTAEMAHERGAAVNMDEYNAAKAEHSQKSREASVTAGAFRGGLANDGTETVKLHTCAHLLLAVLRKNFGNDVMQKGSNITPERLRLDFSCRKIEAAELVKIQNEVNEIIAKRLDVTVREMPIAEARKIGAVGAFGDRYGDIVKVYTIGGAKNPVSMEICGGPHVKNTAELGKFVIQKEEAVGAGVRRIKAVLQ